MRDDPERLIYMRPRFVRRPDFVRISVETVIYSIVFGLLAGRLLF